MIYGRRYNLFRCVISTNSYCPFAFVWGFKYKPVEESMASIITTSIVVLYFLITLLVGAWASKKKSSEDYIVAGKVWDFRFFVCSIFRN